MAFAVLKRKESRYDLWNFDVALCSRSGCYHPCFAKNNVYVHDPKKQRIHHGQRIVYKQCDEFGRLVDGNGECK
jgi:hypothetical protein